MDARQQTHCLAEMIASFPNAPKLDQAQADVWRDTFAALDYDATRASIRVLREDQDWLPTHHQLLTLAKAEQRRKADQVRAARAQIEQEHHKPSVAARAQYRADLDRLKALVATVQIGRGGNGEHLHEAKEWFDCPACVEEWTPERAEKARAESLSEDAPRVCRLCEGTAWQPVEVTGGSLAVMRCPCQGPEPERHPTSCSCIVCRYGATRAGAIRRGTDGYGRAGPDLLRVPVGAVRDPTEPSGEEPLF